MYGTRAAVAQMSRGRAGLTQDEIDGCRDAFLAFDKDRSGTIDVWELRQVLEGTVCTTGVRRSVCFLQARTHTPPSSFIAHVCLRHITALPHR